MAEFSTAQLTVDVPADMVIAMQAEAAERGVTVDALVEEAFRHVGGRIDPDIRIK